MQQTQLISLPSTMSHVMTLRERGLNDEACAALVTAVANFPGATGPWHELARLAEALGHWAEAEGCWRHSLRLDDQDCWVHTSLAAALRRQERWDDAEAVLREAAQRFPHEIGPWHDLARLAEWRGSWAEAESHWRRSLALRRRTTINESRGAHLSSSSPGLTR